MTDSKKLSRQQGPRHKGCETPMYSGKVPKCTDQETYHAWREKARYQPPFGGFCEDCTSEYKNKMVMERRCEFPRVVFEKAQDGFIDGVLYKKPKIDWRRETRAILNGPWCGVREGVPLKHGEKMAKRLQDKGLADIGGDRGRDKNGRDAQRSAINSRAPLNR